MYMKPDAWLEVIRKEYLQDFIHDGGSAVKFIVPTEEIDHHALQQQLREISDTEGYRFAFVDAAKTYLHRVDQLFHEVARQIDWDALAFLFVSDILVQNGFVTPPNREAFTLRQIAALNERDEGLLYTKLESLIEQNILQDHRICHEFKMAMICLCQGQLDPNAARPVSGQLIKAWLSGELRRISEVKPAQLFQKIARHNARQMLGSLSYWLHRTGMRGLVMALDISRCLTLRPKPMNPQNESLYYTPATTLDTYESLRQFIDETDELEFCFIAVIAPPAFLHPDDRQGVYRYDALKLRIWDELRDRNRVNPFSSLVRLSPCVLVQ